MSLVQSLHRQARKKYLISFITGIVIAYVYFFGKREIDINMSEMELFSLQMFSIEYAAVFPKDFSIDYLLFFVSSMWSVEFKEGHLI